MQLNSVVLPAPWADQARDATFFDRQIDAAQCVHTVVVACQAVDFEDGHWLLDRTAVRLRGNQPTAMPSSG